MGSAIIALDDVVKVDDNDKDQELDAVSCFGWTWIMYGNDGI